MLIDWGEEGHIREKVLLRKYLRGSRIVLVYSVKGVKVVVFTGKGYVVPS